MFKQVGDFLKPFFQRGLSLQIVSDLAEVVNTTPDLFASVADAFVNPQREIFAGFPETERFTARRAAGRIITHDIPSAVKGEVVSGTRSPQPGGRHFYAFWSTERN